jgi:putative hydrolase of the HAD superfamily
VRAVTFDLWFTLIWSDADLEAHFRTTRRRLLQDYLGSLGPAPDLEHVAGLEKQVEEEVRGAGRSMAELSMTDILLRLLGVAGLEPPSADKLALWAEGLSDAGLDRPPYLNPEAPSVLRALKADGKRLAIISNVNRSDATYRRLLERHGVLRYFDAVILSSTVGVAKPAARIFQLALAELEAGGAETTHIGDHYATDVVGALAAGITPVLYTGLWGHYRPEMERDPPPNAPNLRRIKALSDLLPMVG